MNDLKTTRVPDERLGVLTHEINNGLAIIAAQCEMMACKTEPESEYAERVRIILEVVHRLAQRIASQPRDGRLKRQSL